MFGRKQRRIDELTARLAEALADIRLLRRQTEELDMRNANLRQQVHQLRLGAHGEVEARSDIVVEVTQ